MAYLFWADVRTFRCQVHLMSGVDSVKVVLGMSGDVINSGLSHVLIASVCALFVIRQ